MKRLIWLTDLHLDHVQPPERISSFLERLRAHQPDHLLIGGDVGESSTAIPFLQEIAEAVEVPCYFVLGNHDYYRGSVERLRTRAALVNRETPDLIWLPSAGIVPLTDQVALVGHGCWSDARLGNYEGSTVLLTDYMLIEDLRGLEHTARGKLLRELGTEAAEYFREVLPEALGAFSRVFVLTHVPPFHEVCRHEGELADDNWLPHFSCGAVGEALVEIMRFRPGRRLVVLSGHTHDAATVEILPNLTAHAGKASYGALEIQGIFEIE
jgi:predicted phosphodiesterase